MSGAQRREPGYFARKGSACPVVDLLLGASSYTYAEATGTQGLADWLGAQRRDEDLRRHLLASGAINYRHGLASVVEEDLVARNVVLAQHHVLRGEPAPVLVAEDAPS